MVMSTKTYCLREAKENRAQETKIVDALNDYVRGLDYIKFGHDRQLIDDGQMIDDIADLQAVYAKKFRKLIR